MIPSLLSKEIPASVKLPSFFFAKSSWNISLDNDLHSAFQKHMQFQIVDSIIFQASRPSVARSLQFDDADTSEENRNVSNVCRALPVAVKKKHACKPKTLLVQPEHHRFTRSCLKLDGYRPTPVQEVVQRPKKRPRAKLLLVEMTDQVEGLVPESDDKQEAEHTESMFTEDMQIPATPIRVLQNVGVDLGIDPEKLSKDKLEADPLAPTPPVDDD
jgi:hypothetical protein